MSARDRERESEIEKLDDLAALRKLRSSRKGQITKIEHDLSKYDGSPIASLKKLVLETTLQRLEKQRHFFSLIQDRILYVLQGRPSEEDTYDEEEREGEAQLLIIQTLQLQLHNHLKAIDISSKAKRVQQKLRMFVESDSLADRDMEAKLSAMEPLIDELLDAVTELPDLDELTELIGQVHLTYRKFKKDVLRATPVKDADPTTSHPDARKQPLYRLPKTDMPTFEGDPKLWRRFWERFSQRLSMHPDLPASLEQAIKPPAGRALINTPEGVEEEYLASVAALKQNHAKFIVVMSMQHTNCPHRRPGMACTSWPQQHRTS